MELLVFLVSTVLIVIGAIMMGQGVGSNKPVLFIVGMVIIACSVIAFAESVKREGAKDAPTYLYIARNMEDLQVDTIHSKHQIIDQYVWVNMDSLWVNNSDPYATSYIVIRQITE